MKTRDEDRLQRVGEGPRCLISVVPLTSGTSQAVSTPWTTIAELHPRQGTFRTNLCHAVRPPDVNATLSRVTQVAFQTPTGAPAR